MSTKEEPPRKNAADNFAEMFEAFGKAMSEIFNDPELKEKAKDIGRSAAESAQRFGGRFRDEDVRNKFREAGEAAQRFGKSVSDYFKDTGKHSGEEKK